MATNAQGKYEGGDRIPKAGYIAALTVIGVDILFVLTGTRTPISFNNLTLNEQSMLTNFRSLQVEDQDAVTRLTTTIADLSELYPAAT